MSKTVPFQTIQFCISTQFSSIWLIDKTLSSDITLGQGGPGNAGNEEALRNPQSSSIWTSASDFLVSYSGHSLGESYSSAEKQSVYSTAPADWAIVFSVIIFILYKKKYSGTSYDVIVNELD